MIITTCAGNAGKDAEYKKTQNGTELCTFSLAGTVGYGDNKQTLWFDVTKWGKGSEGLARCISKGTKVTVSGELSEREHEGKRYLQIRADHIALQGERQGGGGGVQSRPSREPLDPVDDLDSDVPFVTCDPTFEGRMG